MPPNNAPTTLIQRLKWAVIASVGMHLLFAYAAQKNAWLSWDNTPAANTVSPIIFTTLRQTQPLEQPLQQLAATPEPQTTPPVATPAKTHKTVKPAANPSQPTQTTATPIATAIATPLQADQSLAQAHQEQVDPISKAAAQAQTHNPDTYSLPNKVNLLYEGSFKGITVKGDLNLSSGDEEYKSSLSLNAAFGYLDLKYIAQGSYDEKGLNLTYAQDKNTKGSTTAITADAEQKRVVISSKEGFLPYTPDGLDVLSLILQLGINTQTQKQWQTKGTAQDFTVYRPSGIKRWRYQSQGMQILTQGKDTFNTVYIKRVPILSPGQDTDRDYIHHLWLDPARHGLPVRIKLEDPQKGIEIELNLVKWTEE